MSLGPDLSNYCPDVFDRLSPSVILGHTDLKKNKITLNLPSYYPLAYLVLTPCFLLQIWH